MSDESGVISARVLTRTCSEKRKRDLLFVFRLERRLLCSVINNAVGEELVDAVLKLTRSAKPIWVDGIHA